MLRPFAEMQRSEAVLSSSPAGTASASLLAGSVLRQGAHQDKSEVIRTEVNERRRFVMNKRRYGIEKPVLFETVAPNIVSWRTNGPFKFSPLSPITSLTFLG